MKNFKVCYKNIYLQIMPLNLFFCEEKCFEFLWNNEIQMYFPSNDLKFGTCLFIMNV
jgi:hypothetical protein